eukprot:TRINITY_DN2728_c0_g1_i3.p1 TRINITY_DN2728_c0_g1~~TRINITY_DN2728_c0_g1_i3.p1  ORF type:complete len:148 (-),score=6.11 TRINITY_DN2728_c0_g1_i3:52-495(-)
MVFRGNPVMIDLTPSPVLEQLNEKFGELNIPTLSFGETMTCFTNKKSGKFSGCFQIVDDESSNPRLNGANHSFIKVNHDHRQVCKPENRDDIRYSSVHDFIVRVLKNVEDQYVINSQSLSDNNYDSDYYFNYQIRYPSGENTISGDI